MLSWWRNTMERAPDMLCLFRGALRNNPTSSVRYFASGSNHPGEIIGFARSGIDVGVAAPDLHSAGVAAIVEAATVYGTHVFVDSGAFSEVQFGAQGPVVVAPISDAEWRKRLALYVKLAQAIGSHLYAVAPDKVGFPEETLERMARYAPTMQHVAALGANVLVPLPKGKWSLAEVWRAARAALRIPESHLIAAIPSKKAATSTAELEEFLVTARPARVHLLGLGPKSPRFEEIVAMVSRVAPGTELFCDSVLVTSLVGKTNGPGGGPRALTAATDAVTKEIEESIFSGECGTLDYTDLIAKPSDWMTAAGLRNLGKNLRLEGSELAAFVRSPEAWLAENGNQWTDHELDKAWSEYATGAGSTFYRKSEAIVRLFTKTTLADARSRYAASRDACVARGTTPAEFLARARDEAQKLSRLRGVSGNAPPTPIQWAEGAEIVARKCAPKRRIVPL